MSGLYETPGVTPPPAPTPLSPDGSSGPRTAEPQPISRGPNAVLTDEQIRNIIYNETEGLSGPGVQNARAILAHTIINADEIWGADRSRFAGTNPTTFLRAEHPKRGAILADIEEAVTIARAQRRAGGDPTNGATNFHMRDVRSTDLPPHGIAKDPRYNFMPEGEPLGPYVNYPLPPRYINIRQNPVARRRGR